MISITRKYVSLKSIPNLCKNSWFTSWILHLVISLFLFLLLTKSHSYSTRITFSSVQTVDPNIFHLSKEFNSTCMTSFYFYKLFLCSQSLTNRSSISSFCKISREMLKEKILYITILFCCHNLCNNRSFIKNSLFSDICVLQGPYFQYLID